MSRRANSNINSRNDRRSEATSRRSPSGPWRRGTSTPAASVTRLESPAGGVGVRLGEQISCAQSYRCGAYAMPEPERTRMSQRKYNRFVERMQRGVPGRCFGEASHGAAWGHTTGRPRRALRGSRGAGSVAMAREDGRTSRPLPARTAAPAGCAAPTADVLARRPAPADAGPAWS